MARHLRSTLFGLLLIRLVAGSLPAWSQNLVDSGQQFPGLWAGAATWVDFDSDGDLDLALIGETLEAGQPQRIARIYGNDAGGIFSDYQVAARQLIGVYYGDLAWADYDGDGHLDLAIAGWDVEGNESLRLYTSAPGDFSPDERQLLLDRRHVDATGSSILRGVRYASLAWADYDSDGDPDLVVSGMEENGTSLTLLYRNVDGRFAVDETNSESLVNLHNGDLAWADYDNDGDLDLVVSGENVTTTGGLNAVTEFYKNGPTGSLTLDNTLTVSTRLKGGAAAWADYDSDGNLDLALSGRDDAWNTYFQLYRNRPTGVLTQDEAFRLNTTRRIAGDLTWADYDNDGDPDLASSGRTILSAYLAFVFRNESGQFSGVSSESLLTGLDGGTTAWGDYDSDGRTDLLITGVDAAGERHTLLYNNQGTLSANAAPVPPQRLNPPLVTSGRILFSWSPGSDREDVSLTYNLRVGTEPGGDDVLSGQIPPGPGNAGFKTNKILARSLPPDTYYWSVQTVDGAFARSPWSQESQLNIQQFVSSDQRLRALQQAAIAWGDYDNDGDYDLAILGQNRSGEAQTLLYDNDGGLLQVVTEADLAPLRNGDAAWGDYDSDGDLDLLITGEDTFENRRSMLYRTDSVGGSYSLSLLGQFPGLSSSAADWADFDGDGDIDLAIMGQSDDVIGGLQQSYTRIWINDGQGGFDESGQDLEGLNNGDIAWIDFDGDGDPDLAQTGSNSTGDRRLLLYRNEAGLLVETGQDLEGLESSTLAWSDYDGDGDPDLVAGGIGANGVRTRIFANDGNGGLTPLDAFDLPGIRGGDLAWGDYDNDQDQDLIIAGNDGEAPLVRIYENDAGSFRLDAIQILQPLDFSAVSLADIEGDGDLDLISAGRDAAFLPQASVNDNLEAQFNPNRPPQIPTLDAAVDSADVVRLSWRLGEDEFDDTPQSLTYNLRIGTAPGVGDLLSGNVPLGPGNAGQALSHTLRGLASGTYYWSLQTVDDGFARSAWSDSRSFVIDTVSPRVVGFTLNHTQLGIGQTVTLALGLLDEHAGVDPAVEPQVVATVDGQTYPFKTLQFTGPSWSGALTITADMSDGIADISVRGAADGKGNLLVPFDSTAALTIDTELPAVLSSSPAAGSTDIPIDLEEITVTFSEPLDPSTVNGDNFEIELGNQILDQVPEPLYDPETRTVRFFPISGILLSGTPYKIEISAAIQDLAGNRPDNAIALSFDTRIPQLLEGSPAAGDTLIPSGDDLLVATFDAPLMEAVLDDADAVHIRREGQVVQLRSRPQFDAESLRLSFEPAGGLRPGSRYQIILASGLAGPLRAQSGGDFTWSFQTAVPQLIEKSPEGIVESVSGRVEASFSAPIDQTIFAEGPAHITREGEEQTIADGSLRFQDGILSFDIEGGLKPGSRYEVALDGRLAGPLHAETGGDFTWSFQTAVPQLIEKSPEGIVESVSGRVEATFSAAIDQDLLGVQTVHITREGEEQTIADGSLRFQDGILSFEVEGGLKPGSRYEVALDGRLAGPLRAVEQGDFTWTFQTPTPALTEISPAADATDLSTESATVTATFDNPIDADQATAANISLLASGAELAIADLEYNSDTRTLRFSVADGLRAGTGYQVRIAAAVGGPTRQSDYVWRFQTAVPQITELFPAADAAGIDIGLAEAIATFSAPLDDDQAIADNFVLLREGVAVPLREGDPVVRSANRYGLAPAAGWQVGSRYTVQIAPSVGGPLSSAQTLSWSFQTTVPDTIGVSPAAGDTTVSPLTSVIAITFDAPIDREALRVEGSILLLQEGRSVAIGELVYDPDSRTVTIEPAEKLVAGTGYQVRIAAAIGGPLRRQQDESFRWDFSTRIPSVRQTAPADGEQISSGSRRLQVSFSSPIDEDLIDAQNFHLSRGGEAVLLDPDEFTYDPSTFTVSYPPVDLLSGSAYQASISSRLSGPLGAGRPDLNWSFRTQIPRVLSTWPADGEDGVSTGTPTLQIVFSEAVARSDASAFQLLVRSLEEVDAAAELAALTTPSLRDSGGAVILSFAPEGGLRPFSEYQVSVGREVLGELAEEGFSWTFRTAPRLVEPEHGGLITNASRSVELYFPPNALPGGGGEVLIRRLAEGTGKPLLQEEGLTRLSSAYQISTTAGALRKPVTLTMRYTADELGDLDPTRLGIFRREGTVWQRIGGAAVADETAVRTAVEELGVFALFEDATTQVGALAIHQLDCQPRAFSPAGTQGKAETDISFTLTGPADVTIRVYNTSGRLERVITRRQAMAPGVVSLQWDGLDEDREMVSSGLYIVVVNAGGARREKVVAVVR